MRSRKAKLNNIDGPLHEHTLLKGLAVSPQFVLRNTPKYVARIGSNVSA
jgi:hypothetical protein